MSILCSTRTRSVIDVLILFNKYPVREPAGTIPILIQTPRITSHVFHDNCRIKSCNRTKVV
jgi:hypothetical protein